MMAHVLKNLKRKLNVLGVDPASLPSSIANKKGIQQ